MVIRNSYYPISKRRVIDLILTFTMVVLYVLRNYFGVEIPGTEVPINFFIDNHKTQTNSLDIKYPIFSI